MSAIEDAFDAMLTEIPDQPPVVGVGVGVPSPTELRGYARSLGLDDANWESAPLVDALEQHYGAPVLADLDVNLLALAERRRSWSDAEVLLSLKLGTLIDAAVVVNNVPLRGASALAGELGHIKVPGATEQCTCGGVGCLNTVASGSALVRALAGDGFEVAHVSDVVALALRGEPAAVAAVRRAGRQIGVALATAVNLLNPAGIVVWGYLAEVELPLFAGLREGLYHDALPGASKDLRLESAALGELAGVRGAALLVLDRVLDPDAIDRMLSNGSWSRASEAD